MTMACSFAPLPSTLSWTHPPAVVKQCAFMSFGKVALEIVLKGWSGIFLVGHFPNLAYSYLIFKLIVCAIKVDFPFLFF